MAKSVKVFVLAMVVLAGAAIVRMATHDASAQTTPSVTTTTSPAGKEGVTTMNKPSVFVIGDSISLGYGPFLEKMIGSQFSYSRKTGHEPQVKDTKEWGVENGMHSTSVKYYIGLMTADPKWRPDVMILNAGIHDLTTMDPVTKVKQIPLDLYIKNLTAVLDIMAKRKVKVIWVNTTAVNEDYYREHKMDVKHYNADVDEFNAAAAKLMAQRGVPVLDLHTFTKSLGGKEVFKDMCHFTETTERLQAAYIAGYLAAWRGGAN